MFTANTMASVGEALGMSLPGSAAPAAVDRRRDEYAFRSGQAVVELLRLGITARDILTMKAFENAIAVVMALGGSTNAVLHLLAIAREAEVDLTIDDFNRVGDRTPHLADVKPFGRFVMNDIDRIGGVPVVMRELLDAGLLHGEALTVTGKTLAENLDELSPPAPDGTILRPVASPIHRREDSRSSRDRWPPREQSSKPQASSSRCSKAPRRSSMTRRTRWLLSPTARSRQATSW